MKHLLLSLLMMGALQLSAQHDFQKAQQILDRFGHIGAGSASLFQTRGAGQPFTHALDSIRNITASGTLNGRLEMEYNAEGRTRLIRQYALDSLTGIVRLEGITRFVYGAGSKPVHIDLETRDSLTQEMVLTVAIDLEYDGQGRLDSMVISVEDPFVGGITPTLATGIIYIGNLQVLSRQWIYISFFGAWIQASETAYFYNGQGRVIEEISYAVDFVSGDLLPSSRTTTAYTSEGYPEVVTIYVHTGADWAAQTRTLSAYYSNGTLEQQTEQTHNGITWNNSLRSDFHNAVVDDEFTRTDLAWDEGIGVWNKTDSVRTTLDSSLPVDQISLPLELSVLSNLGIGVEEFIPSFASAIDETYYFVFDNGAGAFIPAGKDTYHYTLLDPSGIEHTLPGYLTVSPNPAVGSFIIESSQDLTGNYSIYTLDGQIVAHGTLYQRATHIQASGWIPGVYAVVIRLQNGQAFVHKQMIQP